MALSALTIKKTLKENSISALKRFGQNFLVSESVLNKIIETANIKPTDTVLEIGPGLGVLTFELSKKASKVIAIEKDRKMAEILQKNLVRNNILNVEVINQDALELSVSRDPTSSQAEPRALWEVGSLLAEPYKLVANLPYNIATAVIMNFLEAENPPQKIVVMVQKEVAQRICASPPKMNKLAVFCGLYSTPKIICLVPPTAFYPKPKVDSAILQLTPLRGPTSSQNLSPSPWEVGPLENLINIGFSHPRKTLLNNFISGKAQPFTDFTKERISQWLLENNVQPSQRPETLSIHNWLCLAKTMPKNT